MTTLLKLAFCYVPDTLLGVDVVAILERAPFFEPVFAYVEGRIPRDRKFKREHLKAIAAERRPRDIELQTDKWTSYGRGSYLHLTEVRGFQCLYLQFAGMDVVPLDLLHELACRKGFRAGFCHDSADTFWQQETRIDYYKSHKRPYEHLPTVWDDIFNEWKIDISRNPARRSIVSKMWLQAAWRMWYGEEAQKLIPKDLLLSFADATTVSTLPCGTVFIQLFDDPFAYDAPENRRRQQAFRDYAGFDAIIEKCNNESNPDTHYEHQKGHFAHGGTHRIIRWMDDTGRTVLRSRSTRKEIMEFAEGELLKRWIEPENHANEPIDGGKRIMYGWEE